MSRSRLLVEWILVSVAVLALVSLLLLSGATSRLDNTVYDLAMRLRQKPAPDRIVIVAIDDASLRDVGRWPWPRTTHATLIRAITARGATAIGYDVLFTERSDPIADAALVAAAAKAPLYLPVLLQTPGDNGADISITRPFPELAHVIAGSGHANVDFDSDGIFRRIFLREGDRLQALPHLMVVIATQMQAKPAFSQRGFGVDDRGLLRSDEVLIPFGGPPGNVQTVSAASVIRGEVPDIFFKDKIVLVGATAPGLRDGYPTPTARTGAMAGVEIQANILAGLLDRRMITPLPRFVVLGLSLAAMFGFLLCLLWLTPRSNLLVGGMIGLSLLGMSVVGLAFGNLWAPPMPCILSLGITLPFWGWRRLHAASAYFAGELKVLQAEVGGPIAQPPQGPFGNDLVEQQMTLLHQTNRQIADLRRFVTDVLADLPDAVMVVDPAGRIRLANHSAEALCRRLGVSPEPGDSFLTVLEGLQSAETEPRSLWPPRRFEPLPGLESARGVPVVGPGGLSLEIRFAPTHDGDDMATGWIVQLVDVSELVGALRQREEALQLFTHDMRSPQSAILALLERPEFNVAPTSLRDRIARHARRTLALANGFVQLARAQSSNYTLEPVDLAHMVGDAVDELWTASHVAGVTIRVEAEDREFPISADRTLMTRALINLLDNAVKFSPRGGLILCEIKAANLGESAAVACLITDQGCGMTEDQVADLFVPFTRHPPSISNREGVGLGLALVHSVVVRHGGKIQCNSVVGLGACFSLIFPVESADQLAQELN